MKKLKLFLKENRFWVVVVALILVFLLVLKIIDLNANLTLSEYSQTTFSTAEKGLKGIYESLEKAGEIYGPYETEHSAKSARFLPEKSLIVCLVGDGSRLFDGSEPKDLCEQARAGSTIILAVGVCDEIETYNDENTGEYLAHFLDFAGVDSSGVETRGLCDFSVSSYVLGAGEIYVWPYLESLFNAELRGDSTVGASLLVLCDEIVNKGGYDKLVVDERYYLLADTEEWDILGDGFIMCMIEFCIIVVLFLIVKAQRFGAPEKVAAIERRSETENTEALANLYRATGAGSIGFVVRMETLLLDLAKYYDLPKGLTYKQIANEILTPGVCRYAEIRKLCAEYLNATENEISIKKARVLIERIDMIKKTLF